MIYNPLRGSAPPPDTVVLAIKEEDTCIICLDSGNLTTNLACTCVYKYHQDCLKQVDKAECILCKKLRTTPDETQRLPQSVNHCLSVLVALMFCTLILYWAGILH